MGNEPKDPKSLVLARRAKFVAAALAGVTGVATACGGSTESSSSGNPEPCLGVACCPEEPNPQPCLSQVAPDAPIDAPPDASGDGDGGGDANDGDADAQPQPCLSPLPGDQ